MYTSGGVDRSKKIRLGPLVISPETLEYDDGGGGGGGGDPTDDHHGRRTGASGSPGVDIFNKILVSMKNFMLLMGKLTAVAYKQVSLLTHYGLVFQKERVRALVKRETISCSAQ